VPYAIRQFADDDVAVPGALGIARRRVRHLDERAVAQPLAIRHPEQILVEEG
jgi:hypothetical protein